MRAVAPSSMRAMRTAASGSPTTSSPTWSSSAEKFPRPTWARSRAASCVTKAPSPEDRPMADPFFRVEHLTKRFGGLTAVNDAGFELRRDEIVGLIGPNGAGKTTLLRLITKILRPDQGRIVFAGEDITALRPWELGD